MLLKDSLFSDAGSDLQFPFNYKYKEQKTPKFKLLYIRNLKVPGSAQLYFGTVCEMPGVEALPR